LALSAGKLGGIAFQDFYGDLDHVRKVAKARLDFVLGIFEIARHQGDVLFGGEVGEKPPFLDHISHFSSELQAVFPGDGGAFKEDDAFIGENEPEEEFEEGGFPASTGTDEHGGLSGCESEGGGLDGFYVAKAFGDVSELKHRAYSGERRQRV
jgi:hypothetical protein